jgi:hypothetical protein
LHHRFLAVDALQDGIRTDAASHFLDARNSLIAALRHDVRCAELACEFLALLMAMIRSASISFAESIPRRPTPPSLTTATVEPGHRVFVFAARVG